MLFSFGPHSALLLPVTVPGLAATGWLLLRAARRSAWPDAWLALLMLVPTLSITHWMLGFAGWYDSHDGYSTAMFYVPYQLNPLLGPAFYFRSLTSQEFRLLSKVSNAGCGQNFNDFVNTCRVHEARHKLVAPRFAHYLVVGVALESGFHSKSTFNQVFKKLSGPVPSEVARP